MIVFGSSPFPQRVAPSYIYISLNLVTLKLTLSLRSFVGHSQTQICGQFPQAESAFALTHRFASASVSMAPMKFFVWLTSPAGISPPGVSVELLLLIGRHSAVLNVTLCRPWWCQNKKKVQGTAKCRFCLWACMGRYASVGSESPPTNKCWCGAGDS